MEAKNASFASRCAAAVSGRGAGETTWKSKCEGGWPSLVSCLNRLSPGLSGFSLDLAFLLPNELLAGVDVGESAFNRFIVHRARSFAHSVIHALFSAGDEPNQERTEGHAQSQADHPSPEKNQKQRANRDQPQIQNERPEVSQSAFVFLVSADQEEEEGENQHDED